VTGRQTDFSSHGVQSCRPPGLATHHSIVQKLANITIATQPSLNLQRQHPPTNQKCQLRRTPTNTPTPPRHLRRQPPPCPHQQPPQQPTPRLPRRSTQKRPTPHTPWGPTTSHTATAEWIAEISASSASTRRNAGGDVRASAHWHNEERTAESVWEGKRCRKFIFWNLHDGKGVDQGEAGHACYLVGSGRG